MTFVHRPARAEDRALVFSSWLRSYRASVSSAIPAPIYFDGHHALIERLIDRWPPIIACPSDDLDTICGWACGDGGSTLHYVYVKEAYRGNGVCRGLLAGYRDPLTVTHLTHHVPKNAVFNPYLLMEFPQ